MVTEILFDADGVVILPHKYFSETYTKEYGIPVEDVMPFFKNEFGLCTLGKADLKIELPKYLTKWGWKGSVDEFLEYWFSGENKINEQILEVVDHLKSKGIKCYLATDQEKYRAQYILSNMGLAGHFEDAFFSCDLRSKKDDKEFFKKVLGKLNVDPSEVMYWDDDEKNVEIAKQLGIDARVYRNFEDFNSQMKGIL